MLTKLWIRIRIQIEPKILDPDPKNLFGSTPLTLWHCIYCTVQYFSLKKQHKDISLPEEICAANELLEGGEAQPGQVAADLLSQHEEEVDHVLRLTLKLLTQLRILPTATNYMEMAYQFFFVSTMV